MNFFKRVLAFFFLLLIPSTTLAETLQDHLIENWSITSFDSNIYLNTDSSADITETIIADFSKESHHGIERDLPYSFQNNRNTPIKILKAANENGENWKLKQFKENGYLKVQMTTSDDHLMNATATFILTYHIDNVFNFFDDHDEFYWNVNGTDWSIPTTSVSATIHSPVALTEPVKTACYTGEYGSTNSNCTLKNTAEKIIKISTSSPLAPYEGLTGVISFSKNVFTSPALTQKILWFLNENKIIFLPLITLCIMFFIWYKYGRDAQDVPDTIVPTFIPPKGLSPAETGTLIDERMDPRDLTATIIDYAVKGYIRINEIEKPGLFGSKTDYELELLKPCLPEKEFEKETILGIFTQNKKGAKKKISDLANEFYIHVPKIKDSIMKALIKNDFFPHNPETVRATYSFLGPGLVFVAFFIATNESGITIFSIALAGIIVVAFGAILPRKTRKGTEAYYQLKGLYEYINTAEKDRLKFQEKNNILFEKLLPYAMAFGLIDKWTKAFDGILTTPPSWYYPMGHGNFSMIYFSNSLSNFSNSTSQNLNARPGGQGGNGAWSGGSGFGGGGFSGGGFGGGGGRGL